MWFVMPLHTAGIRAFCQEPFPHPCCAFPLPMGEGPGVRAARARRHPEGTRPAMDVGGFLPPMGHASAAIERCWWPFRANTRFAPTGLGLGSWWADTWVCPLHGFSVRLSVLGYRLSVLGSAIGSRLSAIGYRHPTCHGQRNDTLDWGIQMAARLMVLANFYHWRVDYITYAANHIGTAWMKRAALW